LYRTIHALLEDTDSPFTPSGPTVGEIAALASGIGDRLLERGAPADEPVCLCVEKRRHLLAALLASIAGASPFVLPHGFNPQCIKEAHGVRPFRLILTDTAVEPPEGVDVIRVEECRTRRCSLKFARHPDQPFLSLFTGGSTGKPRIWSKTPTNLFGEAIHLARTFGIGRTDLILPTVPPQHIYGLLASVLLPFVASARVLSRTCIFPQEIIGALQNEEPTVLVSVPIHYRAMRAADIRRYSLRLALSSAAPLDGEDAAYFLEKTGLAINEIYGSTETGGIAIRSSGADRGLWEPFSCLDWKIHEDRLCVRSPFISPDLLCDAEGFFTTADRVAEAGEHRFTFLGRADHIVKIAGKRVDLEEVREKIRRIPGVTDAYVTTVPLKRARQVEIAALVATDLPAGNLRAAIRSMDETYGRPRRVRIVGAIPVLPNGKIDREQVAQLLCASTLTES
jgi:acyl-coenzyme A synthetase/AMP-(fatty) acid ligase